MAVVPEGRWSFVHLDVAQVPLDGIGNQALPRRWLRF